MSAKHDRRSGLDPVSDKALSIAIEVTKIGLRVRLGDLEEALVRRFNHAVRQMGRIFPTIRPDDVVRLSSVLVNVGSSALRRACGTDDFTRTVVGKEEPVEDDPVEDEDDPVEDDSVEMEVCDLAVELGIKDEDPEVAKIGLELLYDHLIEDSNDLLFSVRLDRALRRLNVQTVADIMKYTPEDLLRQPNVGRKSVKELVGTLATFGVVWPNPVVADLARLGCVWPDPLVMKALSE